MTSAAVPFSKGHGTQNDFIVIPDPDGVLDLTATRVQALCDRQRGLGADGVLRVARTSALPDAPSDVDPDTWFMDYRNADGSAVEMCGNGLRVFARYLVDHSVAEAGEFAVGTRSGLRVVTVRRDGMVSVQMGPAKVLGRSTAQASGRVREGVAVNVGNPHLVCALDDHELDGLDLTVPPRHDPGVFPDGVNIEFVSALTPDSLRIRVHERGVGETRSCGSGAVAAVAATLHQRGEATGTADVRVPGGQVTITVGEGVSTLTGPAVFVAHGEIDPAWWDGTVSG